MKILIVDDEKQLTSALTVIMKKNGIESDAVYDGEDAYSYALTGVYDVIILDWMLPKMSGVDVLNKIRAKGISTPVIMLTAKGEVSDKIVGLDSGADDYLAKPFDSGELIARVRALSRRQGGYVGNVITFGDLSLNCETHVLSANGKSVSLGVKEFSILEMLTKNPQRVFSKEMLIEKIWGYDSEAEYNTVEVYISFIRRKLESLGSNVSVKSIRYTGYKVEVNDDKKDKA